TSSSLTRSFSPPLSNSSLPHRPGVGNSRQKGGCRHLPLCRHLLEDFERLRPPGDAPLLDGPLDLSPLRSDRSLGPLAVVATAKVPRKNRATTGTHLPPAHAAAAVSPLPALS